MSTTSAILRRQSQANRMAIIQAMPSTFRNASSRAPYTGVELRQGNGRPGEMDARHIPSMIGGQLVAPRDLQCVNYIPKAA